MAVLFQHTEKNQAIEIGNEEGRWEREGDRKMVAVGEITAQILSITIIHTSHGDV